jgi:DNA mismatch endonuclease (patch repair protein)
MADVFTRRKRSAVMARIRGSKNRSTEERFAKLLRDHGITGWRRGASVVGRPDFVFHGERVTVFLDGCFWHGCPKHYREPGSNVEFWRTKIARNRSRDRKVTRSLRRSGWRVVRFWEHDLRGKQSGAKVIRRVRRALGRHL